MPATRDQPGFAASEARRRQRERQYGPGGLSPYLKRDRGFVSDIQRELKKFGLYGGRIDGVWGSGTEAGWRKYNSPITSFDGRDVYYTNAQNILDTERFKAREIARVQKQLQSQYAQLQANLGRLGKTEGLSPLDRAIAVSKFWVGTRGLAYGAFDTRAREAEKELTTLQRFQSGASAEAAAQERLSKEREQKRSLLGRVGHVFQHPSELPGAALRNLLTVASYGHEQVNKAVYGAARIRSLGGLGLKERDVSAAAVLGGALGLRRFLTPAQQRALREVDTPAEREALRKRGQLKSFGEEVHEDIGFLPSGVVDFAYNLVDPVAIGGGFVKGLGVINSGSKANALFSKSSTALDPLTRAVAKAAEKAAGRFGDQAVGDVKYLQRLTRRAGLGSKRATSLSAALVANDEKVALRYLEGLKAAADPRRAEGLVMRNRAIQAITLAKTQGMTTETRQAILRAALGSDWQPKLSLARRGVTGAARLLPNSRLVDAGLGAMPYAFREVKTRSLTSMLARGLKGRSGARIGPFVGNPAFGRLARFATADAGELAAAKQLLGAVKGKRTDVRVKGVAARVSALPDSELKDVLVQRASEAAEKIADHLDEQVRLLTPAQQKQLKKLQPKLEEEIRQLGAKKGLSPTDKTRVTQAIKDRQAVLDIKKQKLPDDIRAELRTVERDAAVLSRLKPITFAHAVYNFTRRCGTTPT